MQKEPEKLDWNLMVVCDSCDGRGHFFRNIYDLEKSKTLGISLKRTLKKQKEKCSRCFGRGVMNRRSVY